MTAFIVRRLLAGLLTLAAIATFGFCITRLAPGNPFAGERQLTQEALVNLHRYYGFDKPLLVQYANTMWKYLHLDFGPSYFHRDHAVSQLIWPALQVSGILGAIAFGLAILVGVPMGVVAAAQQHRLADHATMSLAIAGICLPNILLGPLLILLLGFTFNWLPVGRWPQDTSWGELQRLIMPAITLAWVHIAYVARLGRAGMLDVLNTDYIRTARAKGLNEIAVILKHGLKNGVTPVLSYAGPMAALIVTGSVVVEKIFDIPGLGQHIVNAALNRDHPLLMGSILIFSTLIIVFNLLVDLAYSWLDPRVRVT
ncbi:Oligopeptide transport system permease protein OppB [Candidatus Entotheonellaceae bacterium PAL068K]